jgi:ABC-type antimicrobial peptide transport system permease subunit
MKHVLLILFAVAGGAIGLAIAVVVVLVLLVSVLLFALVLLQAVGLAPRVPLGYSFRNLMVRWRTTVLTTLAFTLVVALMTVMLAFVNGMYSLTKGSSVAGNVIVLSDGALDEVFSDLGYGDIDLLANRDYVRKIKVSSGDRQTEEPMLSWELYQVVVQILPHPTEGGKGRRMVQVRGLEDPELAGMIHELTLHDGSRWFDKGAGVQAVPGGGNEDYVQAVLGEGIAREMGRDVGKPSLGVGDTFALGPRQWVVVGIMNSAGKTFDSEVWAKRKVAGEMLRKDSRSTAVFRVAEGLDSAEVAKRMESEFKSPAIRARTEQDYFDSLNETNKQFLVMIIVVAVLMAVGGIFGVMNTMFAAVAQRTREIGMLRILGFARWQVLVAFFLEAILLAILGGILGCAIGWWCNGVSASSQMMGKSVMLKLVVDARILGAGMAFSIIMGCLGGLLPALSAIRLKMLDSLR